MGVEPDGDAVSGRKLLMWNDDVEIALCRPSAADGRITTGTARATRSSSSTRARALSRRSSATCPTETATTSSSRGARPTGSPRGRAALPRLHLARPDRDPAPLPQRVRPAPRARALLPPRHPSPLELKTHSDLGEHVVKFRVKDGYQTYVLDYHPFDVVGWDGYVYPWTFNINDFEPITGRIHMPPRRTRPSRGATSSSALSARASSTSTRSPSRSRTTTEPELGGDDLLRLGELRLAQGDRDRLGDAHPSRSHTGRSRASRRSRSG